MYDYYFDSAYASVQNESERYELERNEREDDEFEDDEQDRIDFKNNVK